MHKLRCGVSLLALSAGLGAVPALANDTADEIVVLGSHIAGTPEDAAVPVDVYDRNDLTEIGSPSVKDFIKNLGSSSGIDGETNQFTGGTQGVGRTTINLRGLGAERTLVMFNGRRHVTATPTVVVGPNLNIMPEIALQRVEVLKDGAAALYGSDAIGGVVNLITRNDFEGFEISGSHSIIPDSDGDTQIGAIWGGSHNGVNLMVAAEFIDRSAVAWKDKDWSNVPFSTSSRPYSSIGVTSILPGVLIPGGGRQNFTPVSGTYFNDPQCEESGNALAGNCFFRFADFDNIAEEHEIWRAMANLSFDVGDSHTFNLEMMISDLDSKTATSPSFPPTNLFGNTVPETAPHWADFVARVAADTGQSDAIFGGTAFGLPIIPVIRGRPVNAGLDNGPQFYTDDTQDYRISGTLKGDLFEGALGYDMALTYSQERSYNTFPDVYVERLYNALGGLGGPACDPLVGTPGVGPCEFFNPFLSAVEFFPQTGVANPDYDPALANSPELISWLYGRLGQETRNHLLVFDLVVNGDLAWELPGGAVQFAAGVQTRNDRREYDPDEGNDPAFNPCPFAGDAVGDPDCATATGPFGFFPANAAFDSERTVYAAFGEVNLPFSDIFEVQAAARFEDYGSGVGSTFDPKLAARLQATDWLTLRGSIGTTFRGPTSGDLDGNTRGLVFLLAPLAFKAVDTLGNSDLDPEKALALNVGAVVNAGTFSASLDYWRFDFQDLIETESSNAVVNAYIAADCADGGAGVGTADCTALRAKIFPLGTDASDLERVEVNRFNGPDVITSGIDFDVNYTFEDVIGGDLRVGLEGTHTLEYEVADLILDGTSLVVTPSYDAVGSNNRSRIPFRSLQDWKGNASVNYSRGSSSLTYVARYTSEFDATATASIDSHLTHDLHYNIGLFDERTTLAVSVTNLTDEDPPLNVDHELLYDPFTHSPLGRVVKIGLTHSFY